MFVWHFWNEWESCYACPHTPSAMLVCTYQKRHSALHRTHALQWRNRWLIYNLLVAFAMPLHALYSIVCAQPSLFLPFLFASASSSSPLPLWICTVLVCRFCVLHLNFVSLLLLHRKRTIARKPHTKGKCGFCTLYAIIFIANEQRERCLCTRVMANHFCVFHFRTGVIYFLNSPCVFSSRFENLSGALCINILIVVVNYFVLNVCAAPQRMHTEEKWEP